MIKRTITSEDPFTGEQVTNDFYFHLTKADIIRIIGRDRQGDWDKYVKSIIDSGDTDTIRLARKLFPTPWQEGTATRR